MTKVKQSIKQREITELKLPWGIQKIGPGTVPDAPGSPKETDMEAIKAAAKKEGIWDTDKDGYYGGPTPSQAR